MSDSGHSVNVGVVCPSDNGWWLGGLYYLHHLMLAATSTRGARVRFRDVWWDRAPAEPDPFAAVRHVMAGPVSLRLPRSLWARSRRRVHRFAAGYRGRDLADLFHDAGIDVLFPGVPCDRFGIPLVGWITDFQYRHRPELYTAEHWQAFEDETLRMGNLSSLIMLSSQDVFRDLQAFFPQMATKARVVRPCSVPTPEWSQLDPAEVARRLEVPDRFFLISNQVCAHKNHRTVFEAVRILAASGRRLNIICTGKQADYRSPDFFGRLVAQVSALGIEAQVWFLGALPRAEYAALVRRALAVLQPSEFEGWGFALADALALGKPALVSDLPVHHEHEGPVRAFLPPGDADAWADALARADDELQPGPHRGTEDQARAANERERLRFGREVVSLFREAARPEPSKDVYSVARAPSTNVDQALSGKP